MRSEKLALGVIALSVACAIEPPLQTSTPTTTLPTSTHIPVPTFEPTPTPIFPQESCLIGNEHFIPPLFGNYTLSQEYKYNHTGLDLSQGEGAIVIAPISGKVAFAEWSNFGGGNMVVIESKIENEVGNPVYWLFWNLHLSAISVEVGEEISQRMLLGMVGSTGNSSGDHLHFEINLSNNPYTNFLTNSPRIRGYYSDGILNYKIYQNRQDHNPENNRLANISLTEISKLVAQSKKDVIIHINPFELFNNNC